MLRSLIRGERPRFALADDRMFLDQSWHASRLTRTELQRTNTMEKGHTLTFWGFESVGLEDEPHSVLLLELILTALFF